MQWVTRARPVLSVPRAAISILSLLAALATAGSVGATVQVYGPGSNAAPIFFGLAIPPVGGAFDERGWAGFEFLISGIDPVVDPFSSNDMYLIQGNITQASQAIGIDLGNRDAISGVPFNFSIAQNLVGGRNLSFSVTNTITQVTSVLCWGQNCAPGSIAQEIINGEGPFDAFNGLLVQVRSQDVVGSTVTARINQLAGIGQIAGDPFFNGTVNPSSTGTLSPFDAGRQGQLLIADNLEFLTQEWSLQGTVTLNRPDDAVSDRSKVRIAIDLVRDPDLPYVVPEPSTALLVGLGLIGLRTARRRSN